MPEKGEFLRRFPLHVLPGGLVRIRALRTLCQPQTECYALLGRMACADPPVPSSLRCPVCSGVMLVLERRDFTHLVRVMPDGRRIFVSNAHSASVSIIENREMRPDPTHPSPPGPAQRDWFVTTIPTSLGTEGFDVSPDWKELWTAAASDGKLWIIDTAQRKVTASIDAKLNGASRLELEEWNKQGVLTR